MKLLSVVVPVYYNEESLPCLFAELVKVEEALSRKKVQLELIFVDDGSGDGSLGELLAIKSQRSSTKIVKLSRNFGAFQALKAGLRFVTGDCFMMLSADLQDPPDLVLDAAERWLAGARYVVCARQDRDDPFSSKVTASIYYRLLRFFVLSDYPAGGYDLALMDRALLPYLQDSGKNINTPLFAYWLGFQPEVIYYKRRKRTHGRSRWTLGKRVKLFIDSMLGFSIVPIRLISLVGVLVSVLGFGYGLFVVTNALLGNPDLTGVRGFATLAALMAFLLGLTIMMLGIIAEYIWRIFDEVSGRPEACLL